MIDYLSIPNNYNNEYELEYSSMISYNEWLMEKFLEWEKTKTRRQSYSAFARYIGVSQGSLSHWLSGSNPPTGDNAKKVADKLGYEIYDILDIPQDERPIPKDLRDLINSVPEDNQEELRDLIEIYLAEHG
ncbi:helix-turn-helix transcriptional regulator, partial [bacterium]|nr:helix-turn-helix transcriptional regulator [bacterium]